MKLSSQTLRGVIDQKASSYTASLVRSITPGKSLYLASGEVCRVVSKSASASGLRIRINRKSGAVTLNLTQVAALHPVPASIRRFASFVHSILAYDNTLSAYVNSAIEQAGLPVDDKMNWAKWLTATYRSKLLRYTKDETLIDDAIREVVIHELYEKRVLETNFNAEHGSLEGKDEANKVSAFLSFLFKKKVFTAVRFVQKSLGIGAGGDLGRQPADSLYTQDEDGNDAGEDRNIALSDGDDESNRLAENEINKFLEAFKAWVSETQRDTAAAATNFITDMIEEGYPRAEIRESLIQSELRGRDGQKYNVESFKVLIRNWGHLLKQFAESPNNSFANTGIAKAIAARAAEETKTKAQKKTLTSASLRLAMDDTGQLPHNPYSSNTNATTVIEPKPPVNPNVQQQQNSQMSKGVPASPQEQQISQGEDDMQQPQQKRTIPPEIPGVNHV